MTAAPRLPSWRILGALALLTALGYWLFPGHTFLHSDTQIYVPILERLYNPSLFERDIVAREPHVAYTIYDETNVWLRAWTGWEFEHTLAAQQLLFRWLALVGVWLIASCLGLPAWPAVLVSACFALGATINGPAVLTVEYEPNPRAFALGALLLGCGLMTSQRYLAAGLACAVGVLYHPPTALPITGLISLLPLLPDSASHWRLRWRAVLPSLAAFLVLVVLAQWQPGVDEKQTFFARIEPEREALMRLRASYNWVSMWVHRWAPQYLVLSVAALLLFRRLRSAASPEVRLLLAGLPIIGLLSVPLSWLLLEKAKWVLIPQLQPGRALLYLTATVVIGGAAAAWVAAQRQRRAEAVAWLALVYAIPASPSLTALLWPNLADPSIRRRLTVVLALAALSAAGLYAAANKPSLAALFVAVAALAPFYALPAQAGVSNFQILNTPELDEVAQWARNSTAADAVFVFPEAGRGLAPGIFRARALRALYVDWKGGGQLNFLRRFGYEWWKRWQQITSSAPHPLSWYHTLGIQYVVVRTGSKEFDSPPVFRNAEYVVYPTQPQESGRLRP